MKNRLGGNTRHASLLLEWRKLEWTNWNSCWYSSNNLIGWIRMTLSKCLNIKAHKPSESTNWKSSAGYNPSPVLVVFQFKNRIWKRNVYWNPVELRPMKTCSLSEWQMKKVFQKPCSWYLKDCCVGFFFLWINESRIDRKMGIARGDSVRQTQLQSLWEF